MTTPYLPSQNKKGDDKKSKQDKAKPIKEALELLQGIGLTGEDGKMDPFAAELLKDAIEQASLPTQSASQDKLDTDIAQNQSESKTELKR